MVMFVSLVIAAFAIPGFDQARRAMRISGDGRDLNGAINQAKLLAAADFTRARLYVDVNARTFHVETWNQALNCWQTVNDPNNPCTAQGSPVQSLSPGVTFGFAGVGAPPPNAQPNGIAQAPLCHKLKGNGNNFLAGTACVHFNSRGLPIDPKTSAPTAGDAIYITDNTQVYGVTLGSTGLSQVWAIDAKGNGNWYRK